MYRVILVCLDGSPIAEKAFRFAVEEAKLHNAVLHAVYVIQAKSAPMTGNPTGMVSTDPNVLTNIYAADGERTLKWAKDAGNEEGIDTICHAVYGDPRREIINIAKEIDADLIVLGTKGKSNLEKFLIGSVSSAVVSHSDRTTLVVK